MLHYRDIEAVEHSDRLDRTHNRARQEITTTLAGLGAGSSSTRTTAT
jgi:hypothetical protein